MLLGEFLFLMVHGRDASVKLITREGDDDDVSFIRRRKQGAP